MFNLEDDPNELFDLATSAEHSHILEECERLLRQIVDPERADAQAHTAQREKVMALGGREEVMKTGGDFGFTPLG